MSNYKEEETYFDGGFEHNDISALNDGLRSDTVLDDEDVSGKLISMDIENSINLRASRSSFFSVVFKKYFKYFCAMAIILVTAWFLFDYRSPGSVDMVDFIPDNEENKLP